MRTYGTELKAVAGEGKRRGAIAVRIVYQQLRYAGYIQLHALLAGQVEVFRVAVLQMIQHGRQLRAQEAGDDGRRRLVSSQTVGVGSG